MRKKYDLAIVMYPIVGVVGFLGKLDLNIWAQSTAQSTGAFMCPMAVAMRNRVHDERIWFLECLSL
jgi:hypothetical protein